MPSKSLAVLVLLLCTQAATAGEVIRIRDLKPPKVAPKRTHYFKRRAPAYSELAVERDAWTRAWLLLDISATGKVTRFKFVNRPGFDLESSAAQEAFRLEFEPARDDHDQPVETYLLWTIEWPSAGWLVMETGLSTALPGTEHGLDPLDLVPCRGSGPLALGSQHPVYRDCSGPNFANADAEPWFDRP